MKTRILLIGGLVLGLYGEGIAQNEIEGPMQHMLNAIVSDFADTADYTGIEAPSAKVMQAFGRVPRERYVPEESRSQAYFNRAMGIGYGQTISQPFIVALMTEVLELEATDRVLEIGTGSGYQAAILAELVDQVYTIEIVPELAEQAAARLQQEGYTNISVRSGNGRLGWPQAAPFDAVIVTAAGDDIPPPLVEQLKPGGRLVIPIGDPYGSQMLKLVRKDDAGDVFVKDVLPVVFVPLTGKDG